MAFSKQIFRTVDVANASLSDRRQKTGMVDQYFYSINTSTLVVTPRTGKDPTLDPSGGGVSLREARYVQFFVDGGTFLITSITMYAHWWRPDMPNTADSIGTRIPELDFTFARDINDWLGCNRYACAPLAVSVPFGRLFWHPGNYTGIANPSLAVTIEAFR